MSVLIISDKNPNQNFIYGGLVRTTEVLNYFEQPHFMFIDWKNKNRTVRLVKGKISYHQIKITENVNLKYNELTKNYDVKINELSDLMGYIKDYISHLNITHILLDNIELYPLVKGKKFYYLSHNCETKLAEDIYDSDRLDYITYLENKVVNNCEGIIYTTEEDLKEINLRFPNNKKNFYLPNGTTPKNCNLKKENTIIFVGSYHPPNFSSAQKLIDKSDEFPNYKIKIIGECCRMVTNDKKNVELLGYLNKEEYEKTMCSSKFMINLVDKGSGSHLKIVESLSYGIPTITTKIGSRGFDLPDLFIVNSYDEILSKINEIETKYDYYSNLCRNYASDFYWENRKMDFLKFLK
jgi:hypothetical protein